ncbi:V-type ATP synthase subunit K [Deinococcus cellulosilyticus]|uniref:ATP synthase subunit K n=1 Tax=Deinococcus cellulosilyticus (strain DSM 18568 / NBRC 106333 / KACC 11606 / 5516J-15) TaxID=1223518 RepID=A0A511N003_DEIC1|nr:V-type ATP synthase subunit K [Deinococcus cellulosilyticus]GEM45861.1 ATP synthase subunit K [Deinococcus cellulosilyticus NBRC 106333 = KACC 11606]
MKKLATILAAFALASIAFAQEANGDALVAGLKAIGAGLAVGLGAIGTGLAQGRVGSAAAGVIAESPEKFGTMLILFVIPESLVIFGFVGMFILNG